MQFIEFFLSTYNFLPFHFKVAFIITQLSLSISRSFNLLIYYRLSSFELFQELLIFPKWICYNLLDTDDSISPALHLYAIILLTNFLSLQVILP